jgi:transposase
MSRKRAYFKADEKVNILRKQLLEKVPVSDICEKISSNRLCFVAGRSSFLSMEQGHLMGENKDRSQEEKIFALKQKLQTKNELHSELMEEHLKIKKHFVEV